MNGDERQRERKLQPILTPHSHIVFEPVATALRSFKLQALLYSIDGEKKVNVLIILNPLLYKSEFLYLKH